MIKRQFFAKILIQFLQTTKIKQYFCQMKTIFFVKGILEDKYNICLIRTRILAIGQIRIRVRLNKVRIHKTAWQYAFALNLQFPNTEMTLDFCLEEFIISQLRIDIIKLSEIWVRQKHENIKSKHNKDNCLGK